MIRKFTLFTWIGFGVFAGSCQQPYKYHSNTSSARQVPASTRLEAPRQSLDSIEAEYEDEIEEFDMDFDETEIASGSFEAQVLFAAPPQPGRYAPNRLQAIWIANSNNQIIRTLDANPGRRPQHLRRWRSSQAGEFDGLTGATITNFAAEPVSFAWDLLDRNGNPVGFGTYRIWFELTQSNTNDNFQDGDQGYAVHSVLFRLGPDGFSLEDNSHVVFRNILVQHEP